MRITYAKRLNVATLVAAKASFVLSGNSVVFDMTRTMRVNADSFELEGQDVAIREGNKLRAEATAFSLLGIDVWLRRDVVSVAETGAFAVEGVDTGFLWHRVLRPLPARFLLDSNGVTPHPGLLPNVVASPASFLVVGLPISFGTQFSRVALLVTEPQGFGTLFQSATLTGDLVIDPSTASQLFKPGW